MKKILVINNKYRIFGGEDSNIIDELKILKESFKVEFLEFDNSEKIRIRDLFFFLLKNNYIANKKLKKKLNEFKPDYVYIHNTWFRANLGIFKILNKNKINTKIKIHNFRYECTRYYTSDKHFKNLIQCPMCGNIRKGFFNKYFPNSYLKSFFIILYGKKYFKILKNNNFDILVLNSFHYKKLISYGIPENKIKIFYNPVSTSTNLKIKYNNQSNYVFYGGSLSRSKGIPQLIETWTNLNFNNLTLKIAGDGNLRDFIEHYPHPSIEYLGVLDKFESIKLIQNARAVVSFTMMYEGQPKLLNEASLFGVPSVFPNFGGMLEYYPKNYELAFKQYDYLDAENKLRNLNNLELLSKISKNLIYFTNKSFGKSNSIKSYLSLFND